MQVYVVFGGGDYEGADSCGPALYDCRAGQRRQNDTLTGRAGALHVNEHGQVVESEFEHGSGVVWYALV